MDLQRSWGSTAVTQTLAFIAHMNSHSFISKGVAVHRPLLGKSLTLIKMNWSKKPVIAVFFFRIAAE
jgi:hypothetical protein